MRAIRPRPHPTILGEFLTEQRLKMGLTQKQFGKLIGVSQGYIQQLETGVRTIKNNQRLESIARATHIDPDILYFFSNRFPPDIITMEPDFEQIKVAMDTTRAIFRKK